MFNEEGLLKYVLTACQDQEGGLKDKPGKYVESSSKENQYKLFTLHMLTISTGEGTTTTLAMRSVDFQLVNMPNHQKLIHSCW